MALRKLNTSFLQRVAENQVLRSQIQSLEAERDEAWQQAQSVANEYDQINDNTAYSPSTHSSRVSAKRKSCIRVSKAGLRTPSRRPSQRSSAGGGGSGSVTTWSPPLPLPVNRRPMDILTDSPGSSNARILPFYTTPKYWYINCLLYIFPILGILIFWNHAVIRIKRVGTGAR